MIDDAAVLGTAERDRGALAALLRRVAAGETGLFDGDLSVLAQPGGRDVAVLGFTAHNVVVADVDPEWVRAQIPVDDYSAPLNPPFLSALCARLGRRTNNVDLLTVTTGLPGDPPLPLTERRDHEHPRVSRARLHRDDVRVWTVDGGMLSLGRGLAGRLEIAVEVEASHRGRGLGRALASAGRHLVHLVADGEALWAQIAPGNAASVRAFLAAGFVPVGAEALLVDH